MSSAKKQAAQLVILGEEIKPGKSYQLNLDVAKLHTRTPILVPVLVNRAREDGPVVLLMAGVHGDEINGIEIVRRFIYKKLNIPSCGTIICLPVFNIFGFLNVKRELPDGRDLNRSFPGSSKGSLAAQFSFRFMKEIAPHCDYIIDFHTGASQRNNFSQVRCVFSDEQSISLAKIFNPPFILHSNLISKTLREAVTKNKNKILLFEGGKSNDIEEKIIEEGINGAKRIITHLGMRNYKYDITKERTPILLSKLKWLRSPISGMFKLIIENGSFVHKSQLLGYVTDPFGKAERKVVANTAGYVICVNESPVVYKGDAIVHIGVE